MSKTVVIPNTSSPWSVVINGTTYGPYKAGSTETVPDAVAEFIEACGKVYDEFAPAPAENVSTGGQNVFVNYVPDIPDGEGYYSGFYVIINGLDVSVSDFNEMLKKSYVDNDESKTYIVKDYYSGKLEYLSIISENPDGTCNFEFSSIDGEVYFSVGTESWSFN